MRVGFALGEEHVAGAQLGVAVGNGLAEARGLVDFKDGDDARRGGDLLDLEKEAGGEAETLRGFGRRVGEREGL